MGFDIPHKMHSQPATEPTININKDFNPFQTTSNTASSSSGKTTENFSKAIVNNGFGTKEAKQEDWENFYTVEDQKEEEVQELVEVESIDENITSFIVKGNYILSPSKSGLMVIHSKRG